MIQSANSCRGGHYRQTNLLAIFICVGVAALLVPGRPAYGQAMLCWAKIYTDYQNQQAASYRKAVLADAKVAEVQLQSRIEQLETQQAEKKPQLDKAVAHHDNLNSAVRRQKGDLQSLNQQLDARESDLLTGPEAATYLAAKKEASAAVARCTQEASRVLGRTIADGTPGKIRGPRRNQETARLEADPQYVEASKDWVRAKDRMSREQQRLISQDKQWQRLNDSIQQLKQQKRATDKELFKTKSRASSIERELEVIRYELEESRSNLNYAQMIIAMNKNP